jgi:hypothetical protein
VPRTPCKEGEEEYEKAVFTGDHGYHPDKWKTPSKRKAQSPEGDEFHTPKGAKA